MFEHLNVHVMHFTGKFAFEMESVFPLSDPACDAILNVMLWLMFMFLPLKYGSLLRETWDQLEKSNERRALLYAQVTLRT
jgi:hypothetical protein